jgi:hypothetical protein
MGSKLVFQAIELVQGPLVCYLHDLIKINERRLT